MNPGKGCNKKLKEAVKSSSLSSGRSNSYDGKIAGLYDLEATLGSGHFAVVKLARHVFTGAKVAVKVVDKTKLDEVSRAHLFQEVRCMKLVQHPNVVRLYEVIDTQTKLYLILELGDGGDLYDYIMKHEGGLTEDMARKYFAQILKAISYCHQLHVVHRDLKPENVVFFEKLGVVKLTDFGFSNKFSPGQKLETFCGSLAYSAPEILLGDSYDAPAVDIWSLGVILYMLVCGQPPFEKANDSETLTMIMDCKYTVPPHISDNCRGLIASMLVRDPKKRANLEEISSHPWLQEISDKDKSEYLPLLSRQQLSEDDHSFIIQKMVKGNIATKEEITEALDKNTYNHITATYFLLAEIRLRKRCEEEEKAKQNESGRFDSGGAERKKQLHTKDKQLQGRRVAVPIKISACPSIPFVSDTKSDKRNRKCSIVREEDEDESCYEHPGDRNELRVGLIRRESISDGRLNQSVQEHSVPMAHETGLNVGKKRRDISTTIPSNEGDVQLQHTLKGINELDIGQLKDVPANNRNTVLTHRRPKLHKIRTPSCSSSEASDDDTKSRNKKKVNKLVGDAPIRFRMHRRDSHDDSSDSQDQAFSSSGTSQRHGNAVITGTNANVCDKQDSQSQRKDGQCDSNRKASSFQPQKNKKIPMENLHNPLAKDKPLDNPGNGRRRRMRESLSLDRITEVQEHKLPSQRKLSTDTHMNYRNSLFNLNSLSVAEIKEEHDEDIAEEIPYDTNQIKTLLSLKDLSILKANEKMYRIDGDAKQTHKCLSNGSTNNCSIAMRKFRRLGRFFPAVNFS